MTVGSLLEQGRDAYGRCEWADAYAQLLAADTDSPLEPEDLERLATAAYLTGHDQESTHDPSSAMNPVERTIRRVDGFQSRHDVLAFPIAVVKKYGDDQCGRLAALIAFYGFFSLFPLILVFTSVLAFVLSDDPDLRRTLVDSAFGQFPVVGDAIERRADLEPLQGNWIAVVVGGATAIWGGLRVAQATQLAMNTIWDIPRASWPTYVFRRLRALALLGLLGAIIILSTLSSGLGSSGAAPLAILRSGGAWAIALLLNVVLFTLTYQLLTAEMLRWQNVLPGAVVAAVGWTALQAVGGYVVTHQINSASDVYGTFALVIALLVWISLGAQLTLFCGEINVVRRRRLWPRNIVQPPLSEGDRRVYAAIVERARMRPEVQAEVRFTDDAATPDPEATEAPDSDTSDAEVTEAQVRG
jgi:YihY family inner membrane protein